MMLNSVRRMSTRVPLIKFRQGGVPDHAGGHSTGSAAAGAKAKGGKGMSSGGILEDWQIPARFKRRPISQEECDFINMGGAPQ